MEIKKSNRLVKKIIPAAAAATAAILVVIASFYLLFIGNHEASSAERINNNTSVVILSYNDDRSVRIQNKWLAHSLEQAGLPTYEYGLDSSAGIEDLPAIISSWHNWKQERSLDQGPLWIIGSGLEPDLVVEFSLAWDNSDLVLLPPYRDLKYFSDWQDFASSLSLRWPQDRSMLIYHTALEANNASYLYERVSNEDAWLFPGQNSYPGSSVNIIKSSNGKTSIAMLDTGVLDQYGWSADYLDSISSELVIGTVESGQADEVATRITAAADSLRIQWFLLPMGLVLLMITALFAGIAMFSVTAQTEGVGPKSTDRTSEDETPGDKYDQKRDQQVIGEDDNVVEQSYTDNHKLVMALRIIIFATFFVNVLVIFNSIGLLPLLTASWWITALALVLFMIMLIPDALLGVADRKLEKTSTARVLSGIIWLFIGAFALYSLIHNLIVSPVASDSLIWLISGILMLMAAKITVRRLSGTGCRIWITLPAGAWLIINGLSIMSHFNVFH